MDEESAQVGSVETPSPRLGDDTRRCRVTFAPGDRQVTVPEGTDLLEAAIAAGVHLASECGGDGICTQCQVVIDDGPVSSTSGERLTEDERAAGHVLACCSIVHGDIAVTVPPESRNEDQEILTESFAEPMVSAPLDGVDPISAPPADADDADMPGLSTKLALQLPPPSGTDNSGDLDRLFRQLHRVYAAPTPEMPLGELRQLPALLRANDWQLTLTLARRGDTTRVVRVEAGDTSDRHLTAVVDIGTTTLVTSLLDMKRREVLGTRGVPNPQAAYGDDVITRIIYAAREEGLSRLRDVVVEALNEMIAALAAEAGVSRQDISAVVCAGNTTMMHLLLGIDPSNIRRDPYVPAVAAVPAVPAAEAGIGIHPRGLVICLPCVSSYVGGDIVAGVLASGMDDATEPCMLLDLGTNGEIALGNHEWLVCCSASAGPAFEGSGVRCGVLAIAGAVQRVGIDADSGEVTWSTIGDQPPVGICGSAYIDALAEMFAVGILDRQGAIRTRLETPRARDGERGPEFVLVWAAESATGRDLVIAQTDIENLIRAKGAIFAAARVLATAMGMELADVARFYVSGGFGSYMNLAAGIAIGMLPDLPVERFKFLGNSSLAGARQTLLSADALARAQRIGDRMTNVELCNEPSYMGEYTASLFLPHTDDDLFPGEPTRQRHGLLAARHGAQP